MLNLRQEFRTFLRNAADFVFPSECELCGATTPAEFRMKDGSNSIYCQLCRDQMAPEIRFACSLCGAELGPWSKGQGGCVHCRNRTLHFDSVVCLGMYRGLLKQALLSAKWSITRVNIQSLAELLCERKAEPLQELQSDVIMPVPQHWKQRLTRHFNPAMIVAQTLSARMHRPLSVNSLRRSRRTMPQKRVPVTQRFSNQEDAFYVLQRDAIHGKRILLVDDVLTTGATCSEASRILLNEGATACHVAVIARVLDHSA
ncbi:MAG: ComF family protein [Planctomyces sp.]|nr:ComF family protein [Planctomyces sp.]